MHEVHVFGPSVASTRFLAGCRTRETALSRLNPFTYLKFTASYPGLHVDSYLHYAPLIDVVEYNPHALATIIFDKGNL
jgi:hypothetical protein